MTYTLKTRDGRVREFWCPTGRDGRGGYVYEIDESHPGTTGRQVSDCLGYTGNMLMARPETLAAVIQRARRRERRLESAY